MTGSMRLTLEDGSEYVGQGAGAQVAVAGEVVFNTAMAGYPESLTDPSYSGQILVLTYPLIGNYGVPADGSGPVSTFFESERINIAGLIVSEDCLAASHWTCATSLGAWLASQQVPGLAGVDTRAL